MICGSGIIYCLSVRSEDNVDESVPSFPQMEDVRMENGVARLVYDNAAQRVLIDNDFAREHCLSSENVVVNLELAGSVTKRLETKIYHINHIDNTWKVRTIWGYGCDKILTPYNPIDLRKVRHLFPSLPDNAFPFVPEKRIDILLGLNFYGLHPRGDHQVVENLAAERSLFSQSGWCVGGSHPLLEISSSPQFTSSASLLRVAQIQFHPSSVTVRDSLSSATKSFEKLRLCSIKTDPMLDPE